MQKTRQSHREKKLKKTAKNSQKKKNGVFIDQKPFSKNPRTI
jgi:hypothetical protein